VIDVLINWLIPSFIDWLTFNASLCSIVYNRQCVYTFHTLFCMVCIALYEFHIASFEIHYILHTKLYWSASSSRHFLRFLSNIFKKQARNLCFTSLLFCKTHNDLPTKWIFIKESARCSGIHYYDVAFFSRKWPQQKQFSPTFRNIVFGEDKTLEGKKNDILDN